MSSIFSLKMIKGMQCLSEATIHAGSIDKLCIAELCLHSITFKSLVQNTKSYKDHKQAHSTNYTVKCRQNVYFSTEVVNTCLKLKP